MYWMHRDQRVHDNWALLFAQVLAQERKVPLIVVYCLDLEAEALTKRQSFFMLKGLEEVEAELKRLNIHFFLVLGRSDDALMELVDVVNAGALVADFNPLRQHRVDLTFLCRELMCALFEVDTHNIVPCWVASDKLEIGARTLRPKIHKLLPEFLTEFPVLQKHKFRFVTEHKKTNWKKVYEALNVDESVEPVDWIRPGEKAAHKMLRQFIAHKLSSYDQKRNDPTEDGQSNLSPYLHFGQLSAQRVALEARKHNLMSISTKSFLEELVVRRELSDNFCLYNKHYDSFKGFPQWAQISLKVHSKDKREYVYTLKQFEQAKTHDPLWNAAQIEMVTTGKMHGFMRMYWAKKILEWTKNPDTALKIAIYLNDKYELDGKDPNGYVGVAWSIGGVHDRAWANRPVFGKVRYMNYNGCKRKFDIDAYIKKYSPPNHLDD